VRNPGHVLPGHFRKSPLYFLGEVFVVSYLAYLVAQYILTGDITGLGFIALLVVGAVIFVAVLNDWRRGAYLLITWILFEDFVRKYLGNNMAIYFTKDVLVIILYISFFRSYLAKRAEKFRLPFRVALLVFIWFGFLQMFNPASPSIFYGILGMKVYFLYVPLMFVGYALMESEEALCRFFSFACILILIVAGLGLAQSIIGPTFLNPSTLQDDIRDLSTLYRVTSSGARAYRPTGVFVSSGRFQDFLIVSWLISLGFSGYLLLRSRKHRALAFTTVGVVAAASLMSTSRGVFMWNSGIALVVTAAFLWGAAWRQEGVIRAFRALQRILLFVGIALMLLLTLFPEELGSRLAVYSETLMPNSPTSELVKRTQTYPLQQLQLAFEHPRWPYGYGIGTCTLGGQYVVRIMQALPMNVGVESGFGNLVVELGVVGLILWIVLGISVSLSAWKVVKELRGTPWFPLAFVIFLFSALLFFPMTFTSFVTFQDFVINSDLWLLLGILYRLRRFRNTSQTVEARGVPGG
jgi:hypothetical protein